MKLDEKIKIEFSEKMLAWYQYKKRNLPWRRTSNPYKIWISEVMLQQTQVDTVVPYFERFVEAFPNMKALSQVAVTDVLKVWQGLGYYARARNLHAAAQMLVTENRAELPGTYSGLLKIPGIGAYTAAAIASIAFNLNYPVVDGNVTRVLSRIFTIAEPPGKRTTRLKLDAIAGQLLPAGRAGDFNQAMMELGALVCTPVQPKCSECPVSSLCQALQALDDPAILPVKASKKQKPHYDIAVALIERNGRILIDQRPANGLLGGLWEFPGGKLEKGETLEKCVERQVQQDLKLKICVQAPFITLKHAYTHFRITLHAFFCLHLDGEAQPQKATDCKWVNQEEILSYPFAKSNQHIIDALLSGRKWPGIREMQET